MLEGNCVLWSLGLAGLWFEVGMGLEGNLRSDV